MTIAYLWLESSILLMLKYGLCIEMAQSMIV